MVCAISALVIFSGTVSAEGPSPATAPAQERAEQEKKPDLWSAPSLSGDWGGLRTQLEDIGFTLELFHMEQYQQNLRGGLSTDDAGRWSGSFDLHPIVDFGKMGLIPGGLFFLEAKGHWSDGINPTKVGALFDPNADIAGNHIWVNKWWYRQYLAEQKIELRVGVLETKKDDLFDISSYAFHEDKDFLNFEILRDTTIPHKIGAGAFLKLKPTDWFYFQTAAIDGKNPNRDAWIDTSFHDQARYIGYWETGLTPKWPSPKGPMPGRYRIGWWYDAREKQIYENNLGKRRPPHYSSGDQGYYLGFDQMVWKEQKDPKDVQGLGLFARYGAADREVDKIQNYWELGASYTGLLPGRNKDVTAFAFSQSILSKKYRNEVHQGADRESVYEWYYLVQLTPWCAITPDFQVITNPGGNKRDRDAIIGGIRVRIIF